MLLYLQLERQECHEAFYFLFHSTLRNGWRISIDYSYFFDKDLIDYFDDAAAILNRKILWGIQEASQNKDGDLAGN